MRLADSPVDSLAYHVDYLAYIVDYLVDYLAYLVDYIVDSLVDVSRMQIRLVRQKLCRWDEG